MDTPKKRFLPPNVEIFLESPIPDEQPYRPGVKRKIDFHHRLYYRHKDGFSRIVIYFGLTFESLSLAKQLSIELSLAQYAEIWHDYIGAPELPSEEDNHPGAKILVVTAKDEKEAHAIASQIINNHFAYIGPVKLLRKHYLLSLTHPVHKQYLVWVTHPVLCPLCGEIALIVYGDIDILPSDTMKHGSCLNCKWEDSFKFIRECPSCKNATFIDKGSSGGCLSCPYFYME
jgi:hypothetical protein